MKKSILGFVLTLLFIGNTSFLLAQTSTVPSVGDGSETSPYEISSLENLYWLSQNEVEWDKYFIQTAHINAADTRTWDIGDHDDDPNTSDTTMGFTPIGYSGYNPKAFEGSYDGGGHIIDSLYINRINLYAVGLFGYVSNGSITKLGLNHVEISGDTYAGGIVGTARFLDLSYAYAKGLMKAYNAGFLVGSLNYSTIYDCYAIGTVVEDYSGGLIGYSSESLIRNSYSAVISLDERRHPELLGNIENSFYDTDLAGDYSMDATSRVSYDLKQACTYLEAGWDFMDEEENGLVKVWGINQDINDGYPFLWWEGYDNTANFSECCFYPEISINGDGSIDNPYMLENECHLKWLSLNDSLWDKHFIQMNDINISGTTNWNFGNHDQDANTALIPLGFMPIGKYVRNTNGTISTVGFEGTYNGQGFEIDSLYMYQPTESHIGFFGLIKKGVVKNLGLTNANVTGGTSTGIFVANVAESTIEDCFAQGNVTGGTPVGGHVGGFVGSVQWDSYIYRCYADCDVYSDYNDVGGFAGSCGGNEVSYSYALGSVKGKYDVGGFVGFQSTLITNSYSRNLVISENNTIGGFVGWGHTDGRVEHCYSASIVDCPDGDFVDGFIGARTNFYMVDCLFDNTLTSMNNTNGGIAYTSDQMKDICTYIGRNWDFASESANGTDDYWKINADFNDGYPFLFWQDAQHTGICSGQGVNNVVDAGKFHVYPNPVNSILNIVTTNVNSKVEIIDSKGNIISTLLRGESEVSVDMSSFAEGIYIIREITDNGISVRKIMKN
ncbi:MAG: T9SS type A sorting domain-containing protein [Bacteroidales bacterium]|nr:T9SS type A sorting domain-containing protein [Bacteroidales bacterium]